MSSLVRIIIFWFVFWKCLFSKFRFIKIGNNNKSSFINNKSLLINHRSWIPFNKFSVMRVCVTFNYKVHKAENNEHVGHCAKSLFGKKSRYRAIMYCIVYFCVQYRKNVIRLCQYWYNTLKHFIQSCTCCTWGKTTYANKLSSSVLTQRLLWDMIRPYAWCNHVRDVHDVRRLLLGQTTQIPKFK